MALTYINVRCRYCGTPTNNEVEENGEVVSVCVKCEDELKELSPWEKEYLACNDICDCC